jgi:mannose/fructose/N-acetylgalactosamine-specific phosphotransferase system component IIB
MQRTLLKMTAPAGVKAEILTVEDAAKQLNEKKFTGENVIVLVRDPQSLVRLVEAGFNLQKVNVGNVRAAQGKVRLTKEVHASDAEIVAWKKLDELGVILEAQWMPDQPKTNFNQVIKQLSSK